MKTKFKISNKVFSVLLCMSLLLSYLPLSSLTAFALEIPVEKNITLGASALKGAQVSKVYFGNYQQSSDGNGGYNVDPIKWSVLSKADGQLFLLSEQNLDVFQYHTTYRKPVTWETSTIRSWLNGYGSTSNNQNADYTSDNFIGTAFSAAEQTAIAGTTDKVFLLSSEEAQNTGYGFTKNGKRTATNTAYVAGGGKIMGSMWGVGEADSWWLRSPVSKVGSAYNATYVGEHGSISANGMPVDSNMVAVRPAFNMDLSHVLFTSAAKGGKSSATGLVKTVDISTLTDSDGYKLTLSDSSRSTFKATLSSISNNAVNISYSGATTGANEHISAIVKDASGSVTYYGRLKNVADTADAGGTVTLDLPDKMNRRTDTLYIFNEQYNGDYKTDYASELIEISYTITFDAGDGTVSPTTAVTGINGKLTSLPTPTRENYNFIGWYTAAAGGDKVDLDNVYTGNTTLYAIWEKAIVKATAVTLKKASITLNVGDTETLIATVVPENATVKSVIWNSLTPKVATVDQNGKVVAVAPGTAFITVTHAVDTGCKNTFCVVTVNAINITGSVSISGEAVYGKTLTANYSGNETVTYQWYRGTEAISGATSSTYTLTADDIGKVIKVKVSGTGNYKGESTAQIAGVLDETAPEAKISITTNTWATFLNDITFGLFFKETQDVTITAIDVGSGVKSVQYYLSDRELERDEVSAITGWQTYNYTFKINPDNKYVIYVKVADNSGNTVYLNSDGIVLDATAPELIGIENNGIYYGDKVFKALDDNFLKIEVDGEDITNTTQGDEEYKIVADNAEHTVTVTDKADNVTEYKITVYKNYTVIFKVDGVTVDTQTVGHGKDATAPTIPTKDGYVGKWDNNGKNITSDTTISVVYTAIPAVKPDEVKLDNKTDLEDTKKQLEDMLDDGYTNYDKKDIQEAINGIDDALKVIENVEEVEELIGKLPENITKNDEAAIKAADDAYKALTDYEKSLVDKDAKKALDDAKSALAELNKPAGTTSPNTGDNTNLWLWFALLFVSSYFLGTVICKKKKEEN